MKTLGRFTFFLLLLIMPLSVKAYAHDQDIPYAVRMPYRIVRGIVNLGLGWTEILLRPIGERKTESVGDAIG